MGEGVTREDLAGLLTSGFGIASPDLACGDQLTEVAADRARSGEILTHPIFHQHRSESQVRSERGEERSDEDVLLSLLVLRTLYTNSSLRSP